MNSIYKIIRKEYMKNLEGEGTLLEHRLSGAKLFVIKNTDNNKVFSITFRTPPKDDTGLPHIMEHSVLCGSRKYPLKDPFVELAKGSLNTFLNAMTYPDKTVYPIASCNKKDFKNLMDVYLDAVFYPNIYKEPRILEQEGWHYELTGLEEEITYNGVVYNEMKGASSSPEQVLFRQIQAGLFPNHPYGCDSGGEPVAIPELTREDFLNFHKTFYHPSNSFIYLYGDIDMEEQLDWLDAEYLSRFEKIEVDSELGIVPAFTKVSKKSVPYAVATDLDIDKHTYLSYNVALPNVVSAYENMALEVLNYVLLEAPGAFLKEELLALNIGEDIFGSYDGSLLQPTFSVIVKNANKEDEPVFIECIENTLKRLIKNGLPSKKIRAAINNFEFKTREADFGAYPKGVLYSIEALDTWLYGGEPFECFDFDKIFEKLKDKVATGYFEQLLEKYLLDNTHKLLLQLIPDATLLEEREKVMKNNLKIYAKQLSEKEKIELINATRVLKEYQSEPNTEEALASIPLLELSDIDKKAEEITYNVLEEKSVNYIMHKTFTNNIVYIKVAFDIKDIPLEDISYVALLGKLLKKMSTEKYSYSDLSDEINLITGGISFSTSLYSENRNPDECQPKFEVSFKCFANQVEKTVELVEEIIVKTKLNVIDRLQQLSEEIKSRQKMYLTGSGHVASMVRASSYISEIGKYQDRVSGIEFYKFIEKLVEEKEYKIVGERLSEILAGIIRQKNSIIMVNGEDNNIEYTKEVVDKMLENLEVHSALKMYEKSDSSNKNEGFKTASKVQYCGLAGNYKKEGYEYIGYMKVLQTLVVLDYMWKEIRIKGGAYGGVFKITNSGLMYLSSYRDPNISETYEAYRKLPEYIRELKLSDRELSKYIIGTISQLDRPLTPSMKGEKALNMYILGWNQKKIQEERDQVLGTKEKDIVLLADLVEKVLKQNNICTIGNEKKIEEEKDLFDDISSLFK